MRIVVFILWSLGFLGGVFAQEKSVKGDAYLEPTYDLGCIDVDDILPKYTPVDLAFSAFECVKQERHKQGALIFTTALMRVSYDTERVRDETAHSVNRSIIELLFLSIPSDKRKAFFTTLDMLQDKNSDLFIEACTLTTRLQAPDYFPAYMIANGINPKSGGDDPILTPNFNAELTWENQRNDYLHCGG